MTASTGATGRSTAVGEHADLEATLAPLAEANGVALRVPARRWVQSVSAEHVAGLLWNPPHATGLPTAAAVDARLVAVHGLGDSAHRFDLVALHLAEPFVAVDLPGHGRSSGGRFSRPAVVTSGLLDASWSFAPGRPWLVAYGAGVAIAVRAAARRPDRVAGVVALDLDDAPQLQPLPAAAGDPEVREALVARRPTLDGNSRLVAHLAVHETSNESDGSRVWRARPDDVNWSAIEWRSFSGVTVPPEVAVVALVPPSGPTSEMASALLADLAGTVREHRLPRDGDPLAERATDVAAALIEIIGDRAD